MLQTPLQNTAISDPLPTRPSLQTAEMLKKVMDSLLTKLTKMRSLNKELTHSYKQDADVQRQALCMHVVLCIHTLITRLETYVTEPNP